MKILGYNYLDNKIYVNQYLTWIINKKKFIFKKVVLINVMILQNIHHNLNLQQ